MRNSYEDNTPPNVILALTPELDNNSLYAVSNNSSPTSTEAPEKRRWSCHKDVLKSKSSYFKSILSSQFQEAEASIVFLPRGMFSASVLDVVLCYMYTNSLSIEDDTNIELLQSTYLAADYLGMENLCVTIERHITVNLTHFFTCYCEKCALFVPLLLSFTGSNQQNERLCKMTLDILKLLVQDPEKSLPSFWSSRSLVILFTQSPDMESLHEYLENNLLSHVNKHNAIESLYGCFRAEKLIAQQQFPTDILLSTLNKVKTSGSSLLASDFIFYCTKYPKLLSCVDGITYSFDFLNYLMSNVLKNQMNETNVCSLYIGIVKHLMCRDNVQQTTVVKTMLQSAKEKIVGYISKNMTSLKKLNLIDKSAVDLIAHDLGVPSSFLTSEQEEVKKKSIPQENKKKTSNNDTKLNWNLKVFRSRFSCFFFGQNFKVGQRVQLLNRPISTTGTIVFVGKISSDKKKLSEFRLGIILDRIVGTCDGSINGKRYFSTCPNRGVFVKTSEVILL